MTHAMRKWVNGRTPVKCLACGWQGARTHRFDAPCPECGKPEVAVRTGDDSQTVGRPVGWSQIKLAEPRTASYLLKSLFMEVYYQGLRTKDLASRLGVSFNTISNARNGRAAPSVLFAEELGALLGYRALWVRNEDYEAVAAYAQQLEEKYNGNR